MSVQRAVQYLRNAVRVGSAGVFNSSRIT